MDVTKGATMNSSTNGIDGRLIFRVGIALVMVGLLLLFRYTIDWFGPTARLGLGATASAALVTGGILVPRRSYGRLMQGAGVAGGYVTAWAAHGRYDLVDSTTAFIQMVLVAVLGVALAWRERSDTLNALGLVGAVAAPLLVGGEFTLVGAEVAYQSAVLLLAGSLYLRFHWWVSLAVTVVGSGFVFAFMVLDPSATLLAGIAVWWLVGWAVPVVGRWRRVAPVPSELVSVFTLAVPVGAWLMVRAVDGRPTVIALVALAAALIHLAVWLVDRPSDEAAVQLMAGVGFIAAALLTWLETGVALPLYLLVTAGAAVYTNRTGDRAGAAVAVAMGTLALPVWLLLVMGGPVSVRAAVEDLVSVVIVATAACLLTGLLRRVVAVVAYGMALVWTAGHLGHLDPGFVTAGFALLGLVALVTGRIQNVRAAVVTGLATLGVAVAKLILVDLASADPLLKVALSLGIGGALLAVGYWVGDTSLVTRGSGEEPAGEPLDR